jgi:electron transfer flavoprotein alpha subunit
MIFGLIEHDRGKMNTISLEMLTMARSLADETGNALEALIVGGEARSLAGRLPAYGVTKVHLIQHERLDEYTPEAWAHTIVQLIEMLSPQAVIAPGTDRGNEVLAHVAAITDLPMAANCTEIQPGDPYRVTRFRWGGSLLEEANLSAETRLFTVAPHVIETTELPEATSCVLETFTPALEEKMFRVKLTKRFEKIGDKVSLAEARVVVGGGRGAGSAEGFIVLEELADILGGAVGGSRVATNLGWRPHSEQIGQTGTRIAPHLYIACGISGAIQHMVGCKGARHILVINKDREAPIFERANYGVVGDLHEVIPALIAELKS